MVIALPFLYALGLGLLAMLVESVIDGSWAFRSCIARWAGYTVIGIALFSGIIKIG